MRLEELEEIFLNDEDEFLKFDRVVHKLSIRPDLHAFILLNQIVPDTADIVAGAEHDEIFLGVDVEKLAEKASRAQLIDLSRCGVRYDPSFNCLAMFV
jgi:hypothetical protein